MSDMRVALACKVSLQDDDEVKSLSKCGANSRLSLPVQDLIKLIFDIESMKKAMVEFEVGDLWCGCGVSEHLSLHRLT